MTTLTAAQKLEEQIDAANSDICRTQLWIDKAEASAQENRITTLYDLLLQQQRGKAALQEEKTALQQKDTALQQKETALQKEKTALQEEKTALQQKETALQQPQAQRKHRHCCHNRFAFWHPSSVKKVA